jgi:hypothetical protein
MTNYFTENSSILDETYENLTKSKKKSTNKLDKLVACIKLKILNDYNEVEKENLNNNIESPFELKKSQSEGPTDNQKIEEEEILSDKEQLPFYMSSTPKIVKMQKDLLNQKENEFKTDIEQTLICFVKKYFEEPGSEITNDDDI